MKVLMGLAKGDILSRSLRKMHGHKCRDSCNSKAQREGVGPRAKAGAGGEQRVARAGRRQGDVPGVFTECQLCQACICTSHTLTESLDKHWLTTSCGPGLGLRAEDTDVNGGVT